LDTARRSGRMASRHSRGPSARPQLTASLSQCSGAKPGLLLRRDQIAPKHLQSNRSGSRDAGTGTSSGAGIVARIGPPGLPLFGHDLFGKPVSTFSGSCPNGSCPNTLLRNDTHGGARN
jgi:hypothetical protein